MTNPDSRYADLEWMVFDCGCRAASDESSGAFLYEPCSDDCEKYQFVLAETQRQGKPILRETPLDNG